MQGNVNGYQNHCTVQCTPFQRVAFIWLFWQIGKFRRDRDRV